MEESLTKKAELLLGGDVVLPEGFSVPNRGTATGDGSGTDAVVFSFGHFRVKKNVSYSEGEFELRVTDRGWMSLYRDDQLFVDDVRIQHMVHRCPEQSFYNIDCDSHREILCSPPFHHPAGDSMTVDEILESIRRDTENNRVRTMAFATTRSDDATVDKLTEIVSAVRAEYAKMTIGVEARLVDPEQVARIRDAGANELKVNVDCARRDIFERIYPDRDYDTVFQVLSNSNGYFRKGKLATTITYGLGETDQDVDMLLEKVCRMNVLPVLRKVHVNDDNRDVLLAAGVPSEPPTVLRSMFLGGLQKSAMKRHGLDPSRFHSMCFSCQCCCLVPFKDF